MTPNARSWQAQAHLLAPYLPWTDGSGRPWCGWTRLPRAAPFVLLYLAVSWALFIPLARPQGGKYAIDQDALHGFLYHIPDLTADPVGVIRALATAVFLNHDSVQLAYVTVLLLLFGVIFEVREGSRRTALIFFGGTLVSALVAGALLHALYPNLLDHPILHTAWSRTWSGGSAGCFALMGALAGRARCPWPLLALFALWEANVAWWYLRSYTPAFHLTALLTGFLATRSLLPPLYRSRYQGGAAAAGRTSRR